MRDGPLLRRAAAGVLGVALGYLLFTYGLAVLRVSGSSMEPALSAGAVILVVRPGLDALVTGSTGPHSGDVVVLTVPGSADRVVKRVVATAGEAVAMQDGVLLVDGAPAAGGDVSGGLGGRPSFPVETVPPGHVFVLGDNRMPLASRDSRAFGPVPVSAVRGRVVLPATSP